MREGRVVGIDHQDGQALECVGLHRAGHQIWTVCSGRWEASVETVEGLDLLHFSVVQNCQSHHWESGWWISQRGSRKTSSKPITGDRVGRDGDRGHHIGHGRSRWRKLGGFGVFLEGESMMLWRGHWWREEEKLKRNCRYWTWECQWVMDHLWRQKSWAQGRHRIWRRKSEFLRALLILGWQLSFLIQWRE